MTREQVAASTQQGKYEEIILYAQANGIADITDPGILIHIGNAYEKRARLEEAKAVFYLCLEKFKDEDAANRLMYIAKIKKDVSFIQEIIKKAEDIMTGEEAIMLGAFELLRAEDAELEEQIACLEEYLDEYPNEEYYVFYLELLLQSENEKALARGLLTYKRDYGYGKYEKYVARIEKAAKEGMKIPEEQSIQKILYPPFKKAAAVYMDEDEKKNVQKKAEVKIKVNKPVSIKETIKESVEKIIMPSDVAKMIRSRAKKRNKYEAFEPATVEERFKDIVGMKNVRADLGEVYDSLRFQQERENNGFDSKILETTIFTVSGDRGAGKTMVAVKTAELLFDYGIRESEEPLYVEAKDFLEMVDSLKGLEDVTLIIEDIDRCLDDKGEIPVDLTDAIYKYMNEMKDSISIVVTGNKDAIDKMKSKDVRIKDLIQKDFIIEPYTTEELLELFCLVAEDRGFVLTEEAKSFVKRQLKKAQKMSNFANVYTIQERVKKARERLIRRYNSEGIESDITMALMRDEDFMQESISGDIEGYLKELEQLTGLESVKKEVASTVANILQDQEAEERGENIRYQSGSLHMVFKGGPGTGKTTVARIIGQIYIASGVLPGNDKGFVEVSATDLVGQYIGETRPKTRKVLDQAMGGVLFIDEAYGLLENQYGNEAITEIVAVMENCRDSFMIIFAGYDEDIEKLLDANEGLRSRISKQIHFEDYNETELRVIFDSFLKSSEFQVAEDASERVQELINYRSKGADFGNARGVRKIVDDVKAAVGKRVLILKMAGKEVSQEEGKIVTSADIDAVLNEDAENKKNLEELLKEINDMPGLFDLKDMVNGYVSKVRAAEARKAAGYKTNFRIDNLHTVFAGPAGTGKTTCARKMGLIFKGLGILANGDRVIERSGGDLCGTTVGEAAEIVKREVNHALGGILFIDEAYTLMNNSYGKEAIDTLLKEMEDKRGRFMVIMAGYEFEMDKLLRSNEGLRSRFKETIRFEDFSPEQLMSVFENFVAKDEVEYQIEDAARPLIRQLLAKESKSEGYANARGVRNTWGKVKDAIDVRVDKMVSNATGEVEIDAQDLITVKVEDIKLLLDEGTPNEISADDIMAEIEAMTGLTSVKEKIRELKGIAEYNLMLKQNGLPPEENGTLHMLFLGNAGTGKTTIARKLGQIYHKLGITRTAQVLECKKEDLVAPYVGQTSGKTKEVVQRALGGILFVDEAYTLKPRGDGADYGKEALETLLTEMENNRDDLIVIFAGYEKEIDELIDFNQGLESRFSSENRIYFEDYTIDEMVEIFVNTMAKKNVKVSEELLPEIKDLISSRKAASKNFGNARGVRNIVDSVEKTRKNRVAAMIKQGVKPTVEERLCVTAEDLDVVMKKMMQEEQISYGQ